MGPGATPKYKGVANPRTPPHLLSPHPSLRTKGLGKEGEQCHEVVQQTAPATRVARRLEQGMMTDKQSLCGPDGRGRARDSSAQPIGTRSCHLMVQLGRKTRQGAVAASLARRGRGNQPSVAPTIGMSLRMEGRAVQARPQQGMDTPGAPPLSGPGGIGLRPTERDWNVVRN